MIDKQKLFADLAEDAHNLWIRLGWLEKEAKRHVCPRIVRGLAVAVLVFASGCSAAKAGKQPGDGAPMMSDPDRDGLESRSEADIVIENRDLTVEKQPDGRFTAGISIHNNGNTATPRFKVIFYAGDPGKKGRKVYPGHHNAGPIMPRGTWNEGSLPFTLNEGETEIFVIVDPDNMVDELDVPVIPTTVGGFFHLRTQGLSRLAIVGTNTIQVWN